MHPRSFLAGCLLAFAVLVGFSIWHQSGPSQNFSDLTREVSAKVAESVGKIAPNISIPTLEKPEAASPIPGGTEPLRIVPNSEIAVRAPADVRTPFGMIKVRPGTRVVAVREIQNGILAKLGGREVVMPISAFRGPGITQSSPPAVASLPQVQKAPVVIPATSSSVAAAPTLPALPHLPEAPPAPVFPPLAPPSSVLSEATVPVVATPPVTPSSAPAPDLASAGLAHFSKWLVIATGDEGRGSGSIISLQGLPMLVTNAHVMSGNSNVKFTRLNSEALPFEQLSVSRDYDLAIAAQTQLSDGMPVLEDVDHNAAIGDDVVVLGNSLGSGVVTEIPGKINGIGPDLVEVDAKFVEGNSGSPIIHLKTGKVIAIATFASVRKLSTLGKDSQFAEVRRFGYRLDTAKRWEPVTIPRFATEADTVKQLRRTTDALVTLAVDIYKNNKVTVGVHQQRDNPLNKTVESYLHIVESRTKVSSTDILTAKERLMRSAISLASLDFQGRDFSGFTGYHAKEVNEERESRKFLERKFSELLAVQDADRRIRLP